MPHRANQPKTSEAAKRANALISHQPPSPAYAPCHSLLQLHSMIGNRAMGRILQAKLKVNEPGDVFEREADAVAESVMRMPEPMPPRVSNNTLASLTAPAYIQRKCAECESGHGLCPKCAEEEKQTVQRKPLVPRITPRIRPQVIRARDEDENDLLQAKEPFRERPAVSPSVENQINGLHGNGQPLSPSVRAFFEPRFGHDFSAVRVHTDSRAAESARAVNARAYTMGRNVVFGVGQYAPGTSEGRRLLGHELTHVVQQGQIRRIQRKNGAGKEPEKEPKLLKDFASKFSDAADLIRKSPEAMKLVKEAEAAGVKFGGYAEDGPGKRAWPYTVGETVYISKARADKVVAMSDFLFELNNAVRAPKFAEISKEAVKGTKGKLTAKEYAYKIIELEVEGMLRMGEIWFEMKKTIGKGEKWDKYDSEFFLSEYKEFKGGKKTKDDIVKDVLKRVRNHEPHKGMTIEQHYMEDYKELSGGK